MSLETYYRTFLKSPYETSALKEGGSQSGGSMNRFGGPLSGNSNHNVLFGSPTGGINGHYDMIKDIRGPYTIGGKKHKKKNGKGKSNSSIIGSPFPNEYLQEFGPYGSIRAHHGSGALMNNFINPQTYHGTWPLIGTNMY